MSYFNLHFSLCKIKPHHFTCLGIHLHSLFCELVVMSFDYFFKLFVFLFLLCRKSLTLLRTLTFCPSCVLCLYLLQFIACSFSYDIFLHAVWKVVKFISFPLWHLCLVACFVRSLLHSKIMIFFKANPSLLCLFCLFLCLNFC